MLLYSTRLRCPKVKAITDSLAKEAQAAAEQALTSAPRPRLLRDV